MQTYVRHYEVAGITIRVESELPMTAATFDQALETFRVESPSGDTVILRHHFAIPDPLPGLGPSDDAHEIYRTPPWAIYQSGSRYIYLGIGSGQGGSAPGLAAVFATDHSSGDIYSGGAYEETWRHGGLTSFTLFTTDQILVARLMAERSGCLVHSAALSIDGQGLLFAGHSESGKSTLAALVRERLGSRATILCDDRNAVRLWPEGLGGGPGGFYVYGTWSHGDVPLVAPGPVPLRAILFLDQAPANELVPIIDHKESLHLLLGVLVRSLITPDWWEKELDVLEQMVSRVPCYTMRFDTSGVIVGLLERLVR